MRISQKTAFIILFALMSTTAMCAVVETDQANSSGYAVPPTSANLLVQQLAPGGFVGVPANAGGAEGTSTNWALLTDGSFGTVNNVDGTYVAIGNGNQLTYTLNTSVNTNGYTVTAIDVYSGWRDGGRMQQDYIVSYSTVLSPSTFITLHSVAYHPGGSSAYVRLDITGILNVKSIRFDFPTTQNGYVGYREIAATGVASPSGTVETDSSNNTGFTVPSVGANILTAATLTAVPATASGLDGTSTNWNVETDGSFGTPNATDATYAYVGTGAVLTYTFPTNTPANANGYSISSFDVYTGYLDNSRVFQDYTVSYSSLSSPAVFVNIATVAYHPATGSCAQVHLALAAPVTGVKAVRFTFGTQQNGFVGLRELAAAGSAIAGAIETDAGNNTGFSVPSVASNLLATATLTAVPVNPPGQEGTSTNWGVLVNGSFGTVNNVDTTMANATNAGDSLTYTLNTSLPANAGGYNITTIDTYTGWRDGGRMFQDYTVSYATVAAPGTFINIASIAYHPNNSSAWVHLDVALSAVKAIRFTFATQQNGYVGYREVAAGGTPIAGDIEVDTVSSVGFVVPTIGTNLLNGVTPVNVGGGPNTSEGQSSNFAILADGSFGSGNSSSVSPAPGSTLTYTLDTSFGFNSAGYTVTAIDTYSGWADAGRINQNYTVAYSTVAAPGTFTNIRTVAYGPGTGNSTQVHIGLLPIPNVKSIRFSWTNPQQNGYVGMRELAVQGFPTPAPTASAGRGVFSSAAFNTFQNAPAGMAQIAGQMSDTNVGLSGTKNYVNTVKANGGNVVVNNVGFIGTGTGTTFSNQTAWNGTAWSFLGTNAQTGGGTNNVGGQLNLLLGQFFFNGSPATYIINSLTPGQTYSVAFYNRTWATGDGRTMNITASSGASINGIQQSPGNAGDGNVWRYTFVATAANETLTIAPVIPGTTMHVWGYSTEYVFNNYWASGSNWSSATWRNAGVPNAQGTNAMFSPQGAPTSITLDVPVTVGHVQFDGTNAWTVSGANSMTLRADNGGVSVLSALAGSHVISTNIAMNNGIVKFGNGTLELSGNLSGAGNITVSAGTLILSGTNTFTGSVTVNPGATLRIGSGGATGSIDSVTSLANNGGIVINRSGTLNLPFAISGTAGITNSATATVNFNAANTFTGPTTFNSGTIGGTASLTSNITLNGPAAYAPGSGGGGKLTSLSLTMNASSISNFELAGPDGGLTGIGGDDEGQVNGNLTIGGTLNITNLGGLATGAYRLFGYTGTLSGTFTTVNAPPGYTVGVDTATFGIVMVNVVQPPGGYRYWIGGNGNWDLSTANWRPGDINGPTGAPQAWSNAGNDIAVFDTGTGTVTLTTGITANNVIFRAGPYTVTGNTLTVSTGGFDVNNSITATVSSLINSGLGLTKNAPGTLIITATNPYLGTTTVTGGILRLSTGTNIIPDASAVTLTAGTLDLNSLSETVGPLSGAGAITLGTGTLTVNEANSTTYSGQISGGGGFVKSGTATLTMSGASTYGGATTVGAGTLRLGVANALPAGTTLTLGTAGTAGTLDMNGFAQSLGGLLSSVATGNAVINSGAGTPALTLSITAGENIFNGSLGLPGSAAFALTKTGNGTLTLGGGNSYTGATLVNGGTLKIGSGSGSGLVAHYPFENNFLDASGRGHTGTDNNGVTFVAGRFGQGANFTSGRWVSVPYAADLGVNSFTVSAWVNFNGTGGGYGIVGTRFGGDTTFDYKIEGGGYVHGDVGDGVGWINTGVDINPAGLTAGTWNMITYVIDNGTKQFRLYINGVLRNTIGFAGTPLFMSPAELMGIGQCAPGEFMNGTIDDVCIFNRPLSTAEVLALTNGLPSGSPIPDASPITLAAGTTLDVNGATEAVGTIAGGGNVNLNGGTLLTNSSADTTLSGVISGAGIFEKTGAATLTLSGVNTYTGSMRVDSGVLKLAGGANRLPVASTLTLGTVNTTAQLDLGDQDQTLAGIATGAMVGSRVVNSGSATPTFTLNVTGGASLGAKLGDAGKNGFNFTKSGTGTLTIADGNTYSGTTNVSAGTLRIAAGSGNLVGYYPFDGDFNDASGRAHHGTPINSPAFVTGKFGQAADFNGTNQVNVAQHADFSMSAYTISAWVNINSPPGTYGIVSTRFGPDTTFDYKVQATNIHGDFGNGAGTWFNTALDINAGDTGSNGQGGQLTVGVWYMITYVIDNAAQTCRLYIDGDLKRNVPFSGTPMFMVPGQMLVFGESNVGVEHMNGKIDDIRIYNSALSTLEVQQLLVNVADTDAIPNGSAVTVATGATLDLNGGREVVGSISGGGNVTLAAGTLTAGGNNASTAYDGVISGTGSLVKNGSGTLTMSASHTYTGSTTISAGTLQSGTGGPGGALATSSIVDNGVLLFNSSSSFGIAGVISGTGTLTQLGSGTLSLSGANTYTGGTGATNGTLSLNNTAGSATGTTAITIQNSATISGSGTVTGTVTLSGSASIAPGNAVGKLTTGALILAASGNSNFELKTPDNGAANTGGDDEVQVNGNLTLGGTLNFSDAGGLNYGTYRLFGYSGTLAGSYTSVAGPTDFGGRIDTATPGVVKLIVNRAPVGTTPVQNIPEAATSNIQVTATDDPAETMTFTLEPPVQPGVNSMTPAGLINVTAGDGPSTMNVSVRITDNGNPAQSSLHTVQINVINVAPTATFANGGAVDESSAGTVTFSGATDVSPADVTAGFKYSYDFDNDGIFEVGGNSYVTASASASVPVPGNFLSDGPGTRTVHGRVWDKDDGFTDYTTVITINNVPPTAAGAINSAPPAGVNEGTASTVSVTLNGGTDVSPQDVAAGLHYAFDFDNNGTFETGDGTYLGSGASATANVPVAFFDDGTMNRVVKIRVIDKNNGSSEYTTTIVVNNVAPIASLGNNGAVDEGSSVDISFTAQFDPSTPDTNAGFRYSYVYNYPGGSPVWDIGGSLYGTASTSPNITIPPNAVIQGPAVQTVLARIWDKNDGFTDYTTDVTIDNVPPSLTNLSAPTIDENDIATLSGTIVDPGVNDTFELTVDWGDGSPVESFGYPASATGSQDFSLTHRYLENGGYQIGVVVVDIDGDSDARTVPITVNNVAPSVSVPNGLAPHIDEHSTTGQITLATFTDPGTLDTHTVTVDWGDGSPLDLGATLVEPAGATPGSVLANHLYDDGFAVHTVTVTVTDDDNDADSATFNVIVDNVPPTADFQRPDAGSASPLTSVQFVNQDDVSDADEAAGFLYSYDFNNDGIFEITLSTSANATVPPQFVTSNPNHTVRGRITDKDGGNRDYLLQQPFFLPDPLEVIFDLGAQSSYTIAAIGQPEPAYSVVVVDLPDSVASLAAMGLAFDGVNKITGIPTVGGMLTLRVTATNAGGSDTADLLITIRRQTNSNSPQVISEATATPNPVIAGKEITFQVVATDRDGDVLSYFWDFGDGTSSRSRVAVHTYTNPGKYVAVVVVSDGKNNSGAQQVNVTVAPGSENTFTVQLAKLAFDFRKPAKSTLYVTGLIPAPAGSLDGVDVLVSITGSLYSQTFHLNSKGAGGDTMSLFSLKTVQSGVGTNRSKFIFSLKSTDGTDPLHPSLHQMLLPIGFIPGPVERAGRIINVPLVVTIGNTGAQTSVIPMNYKTAPHRTGKGQYKGK